MNFFHRLKACDNYKKATRKLAVTLKNVEFFHAVYLSFEIDSFSLNYIERFFYIMDTNCVLREVGTEP